MQGIQNFKRSIFKRLSPFVEVEGRSHKNHDKARPVLTINVG
jgi:hypothetical protein